VATRDGLYTVSGGGFSTTVSRAKLEATFAGMVLLREFSSRSIGLWTSMWQHAWYSRTGLEAWRIETEVQDFLALGPSFTFAGGSQKLTLSQNVLERKWSGRLYIIGYKRRPSLVLKYFWRDIRLEFRTLLGRLSRPTLDEVRRRSRQIILNS
jgi:hypothetical protein